MGSTASSSSDAEFLHQDQASRAAAWNNERWTDSFRQQILSFLRGTAVDADAEFGPKDAQRVARHQYQTGSAVDGELGPMTMAVLLHLGLRFHAHPAAEATAVTLLFYPGEFEDLDSWRSRAHEAVAGGGGYRDIDPPPGAGRIYVQLGGQVVARYIARGGPPLTVADGPHHTADPTAHGTWTLGPGHPIVTSSWPYSQIPWGAELRRVGDHYQFRAEGSAEWCWATGPSCTLKCPLEPDDFNGVAQEQRDGQTCLRWNKNDFGRMGWNLLKTADFIHTTPDTEEAAAQGKPVRLAPSHGCIHVVPGERDEMMARGYLQQGVHIVVKGYDEHLLPAKLREQLPAQ